MDNDTPIMIGFFLILFSGAFDAVAETLKWHPSGFFRVFKNANLDFWLIGDSWDNKWKNGDPAQGEKFWQSSRAFVALTDGYHLMRLIKNNLMFLAAMAFFAVSLIVDGKEVVWYMFPIAFALSYSAYTVGFSFVYDRVFGENN